MIHRLRFLPVALLMYIFLYAGISFAFKDYNFSGSVLKKVKRKNETVIAVSKLIVAPFKMIEEFNKLTNSDSVSALPDSLSQIDTLLIAHKSEYRMKLYSKGKLLKTYRIALGQSPVGHKQIQGDDRTPEGDYKIIQKSRGPFYGDYSQYLGVAWMRINYPNNTDAINGFKNGLISEVEKNAIILANNSGKEPPKNTKLGGGIGIHGWYGNWPGNDKQCLTWGCISMQNKDLDDLYNRIPLGTRILILP